MTATINASTTAGVVTTADTSGILQLQTNGTAALTVDASQNVGIGTSSPGAKFSLTSTGSTTADGVRLTFGSEARAHNIYSALSTGRDLTIAPYRALTINTGSGTAEGVLGLNAYEYTTFGTGSSYTERMRITSTGLVGIGTTSPTGILNVKGTGGDALPATSGSTQSAGLVTRLQQGGGIGSVMDIGGNGGGGSWIQVTEATDLATNYNLLLNPNGGNLLVGGTSATQTEKLGVYQKTNFPAIFINPSFATFNGTVIYTNTTRAASSAFDFIGCYGNNVGQFRVQGSGVIYAQNTSVQSISDQRLKENIRDSSDGLSVISGLRPVRYDWKEGHGNNQKNQLGFIAQEIETVFPEAVSEWQVDKNDETVYKTVGPGALIPVLVKAIQELKAIVDAQGAEIAALKGATA